MNKFPFVIIVHSDFFDKLFENDYECEDYVRDSGYCKIVVKVLLINLMTMRCRRCRPKNILSG